MTTRMISTRRMGALALIFALIGMLFGAMPASAQTDQYTIEIHKLEQPDVSNVAGDGLPQDTAGLTPIPGATFTATRVPGIDISTNDGQKAAAELSIQDARELVEGEPVAATDITDAQGNATLGSLSTGVYYVQESDTPAGYVGSAAFMVSLPLTNPVSLDSWLSTVHVYPKDAQALISLDVIDQDAVKLGDTVHWVSHSDIPRQATIDGYRVEQIITPKLELVVSPATITTDVRVSFEGDDTPLVPNVDYTLTYDERTRTVTADFLEPGLTKLEAAVAKNPATQVRIDYDTIVRAEGIHVNEAVLYSSRAAIEKVRGVTDTATTKWGPLSVIVHEHGNPANLIEGARFEVFLTEEDARAGHNPISINGVSEWTTDANGRLIVNGLRFSDFANDLDRDTNDPLYRIYWAAPTFVPPEWRWVSDTPLYGAVNDVLEYQTLIFEVVQEADPVTPDLPITGAQIAGIGVLGAVLIGGGLLAIGARRRSQEA